MRLGNTADPEATTEEVVIPETQGILREVWAGITGENLEDLIEHPVYLESPVIRDVLSKFEAPRDWGTYYGTRLRGYLLPPQDGYYQFWISGDDECALYLSSNEHAAGKTLIARVPDHSNYQQWDKDPAEQSSDSIYLKAGEPYYIEALQKEHGGYDHLSVGWIPPGKTEISVIPGEWLRPCHEAPGYDEPRNLLVNAGEDFDIFLPRESATLQGQVIDHTPGPESLSVTWELISGPPGFTITSPAEDITEVLFSQSGEYVLRLTAADGLGEARDEVTLTVHPPLHESAGSALREIWFDVSGSDIADLRRLPAFPHHPHVVDRVTQLSIPRYFSGRYGTRISGYILPPVTGEYVFWISGDESACFYLSSSDSPDTLRLIARANSSTGYRQWHAHPLQKSAPVLLEAGKRYYFHTLHKEYWGDDHVDVAWSLVEDNLPAIIQGEFLAPPDDAPDAPTLDPDLPFYAAAGRNQEFWAPYDTAQLEGNVFWTRGSDGHLQPTTNWTQVSGPGSVIFSNPQALETEVEFPSPGQYVLRLTAASAEHTSTSDLTVSIHPALDPRAGSVFREVWMNVYGNYISNLRASAHFPDYPDLVDRMFNLQSSINWSSNYGTRIRGYLHPPESGYYQFWVRGDDQTQLHLQTSPGGSTQLVAHVPGATAYWNGEWTKYAQQKSQWIALQAGERYYFELLHKEGWGGDHFAVAWMRPGAREEQIIPGWALSPVEDLPQDTPPADSERNHFVYAGQDQQIYLPWNTVDLEAEIFEVAGGSDQSATYQWSQVSGPGTVTFTSAASSETLAAFPAAGTYLLRVETALEGDQHSDDVQVTVHPPLQNGTGTILRQVWLNVYGSQVEDLTQEGPYNEPPDFEERLTQLDVPANWANYYGQQLTGYLHPPQTGLYTFWIASNHDGELYLSSTENPADLVRIAHTSNNATSPYDWDRFSTQESDPVMLEAGKKYFLRVLHKEHTGSDYLQVAWEGPGTNGRELLKGSFLSPLDPGAPLADGQIEVSAGVDATMRWPRHFLELQGYAYDVHPGPSPLTYSWSATGGAGSVNFSTQDFPGSTAEFPGPGEYELTLTVTDGENTTSHSITVNVLPRLGPDTGFVTREVWLDNGYYYVSQLVSDPRYPDEPTWRDLVDGFQTPQYWGDDYGQRLRGYVYAPVTGQYRFAIAGDYNSQIYLSSNEDPAGKELVAEVPYWSYPGEYDRWEGQISEPVTLEAGQRYYVEVLHNDGVGRDFVEVAWERPDRAEEGFEVIRGEFTAPWDDSASDFEEDLVVSAGADQSWVWPVNQVSLQGFARDLAPGPYPLQVQWSKISGPGEVAFADAGKPATTATFSARGTYVLQIEADDGHHTRTDRLQVTFAEPVAPGTGSILREVYTDIKGSSVYYLINDETFPDAPTFREHLTLFESPVNERDNYGQVLRGYLNVPQTGDYTFYISSDDQSELLLSPTADPAMKRLICQVPDHTDFRDFWEFPAYQQSFLIRLEAGQQYYIEARHKEGGGEDHLSVAWTGPGIDQPQIIQGGYLSPWDLGDGQAPQITLQGDNPLEIVVGTEFVDPGYSASDNQDGDLTELVEIDSNVDATQSGTYRVIYTVTDSAGNAAEPVVREVRVVTGDVIAASYPPDTSNPTDPPPFDPNATITPEAAARLLSQATFGPTEAGIDRVRTLGYEGWVEEQLALPASLHLPLLRQMLPYMRDSRNRFDLDPTERKYIWWTRAVLADDQLRQRVAFALSQILVISDYSPELEDRTLGVTNYYDILVRNAFGNYRDILEEVTLSPMMGIYLTMLRSTKESPDENYARELLQLFTIGLNHFNQDGSLKLDGNGQPISTYDNDIILELSKAFTGWTFNGSTEFYYIHDSEDADLMPMMAFEEFHHKGSKVLMGGATVPAGQSAYEDISTVLDIIFNHPNVGPFVSRQLIQRLVTSNPSPGYIYRVAEVFNDNGQGVRGDLGAVVKAILLDPEARSAEMLQDPQFGKPREPLLRLSALLRAFEHIPSGDTPTLGRVVMPDLNYTLGQDPLYSPSVFNFFYPDYQLPGPLQREGLYTPEFQIITEPKTIDTANFLHEGIEDGWDGHSTHAVPIELNLQKLIAQAQLGHEDLLDYLDLLLTHGQMSAETRASLLTMLQALSTDSDAEFQATAALQLLSTAPEFAIQR